MNIFAVVTSIALWAISPQHTNISAETIVITPVSCHLERDININHVDRSITITYIDIAGCDLYAEDQIMHIQRSGYLFLVPPGTWHLSATLDNLVDVRTVIVEPPDIPEPRHYIYLPAINNARG